MDKLINNLAEEYFNNDRSKNEENVTFVRFERENGEKNAYGIHSNGISGYIIYKKDEKHQKSEKIFIKYLHTEKKFSMDNEASLFSNEIYFYSKIEPFLSSLRNLKSLVPKFYASQYYTSCAKDDAIIMLKHLDSEGFRNCIMGFLDYAHLSLMIGKIGEFHSYSYAAKIKFSSELDQIFNLHINVSAANALNRIPELVPTLLKNLQPLRAQLQYAQGVSNLEEIINNFNHCVRKIMVHDIQNSCSILCHRSYTKNNVLFKYEDEAPADMKIMDWQTVGFASLGMDLVILLFVETNQETRNKYWDQLLDDYRSALVRTFSNSDIPTKDRIFDELKISIPFALYVLAFRANRSRSQINTENFKEVWNLWNDELITETYKEFIRRKLV